MTEAAGDDADAFPAFAATIGELLDRPSREWVPEDRLDDVVPWDSLAILHVQEWLEGRGRVLPAELWPELVTLGDLHHYATQPLDAIGGATRPEPILRAVALGDEPELFALLTHPSVLGRFRWQGTTPSHEVFHAQLWERVLVQYAVRATPTGPIVGLVTAYDADLRNGHAHIAAVAGAEVIGSGLVADATVRFVDELFHAFPLRKLYAEVAAPNLGQFASGTNRHFAVEGRLTDHLFNGGRYEDLLILACSRTRWESARRSTR